MTLLDEFQRIVLRGGAKARLVTTQGFNKAFPVVVLVEAEPFVIQLTTHGRYLDDHSIHRLDMKEHDVYCYCRNPEEKNGFQC